MPTCSQAKIITNLEYDLSKRLYNYTDEAAFHADNSPKLLRHRSSSEHTNIYKRPLRCSVIKNEEFYITKTQDHSKLPSIHSELVLKRDSVPVNFLYNSTYRQKSLCLSRRNSKTYRRASIDEDSDSVDGANHDYCNNSSCSSSNDEMQRYRDEYHEYIVLNEQKPLESQRKRSLSSMNNLPRLAMEIAALEDEGKEDNMERVAEERKKHSVINAKRLLAIASIRPSKTFHKEITPEESNLLKKYYEILRPRFRRSSNSDIESNTQPVLMQTKADSQVPILFESSKLNVESMRSLEVFLSEHKEAISSGKFVIEFDTSGFHNCFVLKNKENNSVVRLPENTHDTFVALAMSRNSKKNSNLSEEQILKSINWNDSSAVFNSKTNANSKPPKYQSGKILSLRSNDRFSCSSSSITLDSIRSLSSIVSSIVEPNLLTRMVENTVDLSCLPGGINFEMPPLEKLELGTFGYDGNMHGTNGKLKNAVYKKLKEKISSTKVMWFSEPPARKPLSIIFDYGSVDITHKEIMDEVNKSLKGTGQVVEVEFVPRSVHFSSVYVENMWIVSLTNKDAKYHTISSGIHVNDQKIMPKSYDEYINLEYEKYIRSEKYKKLIKNHEKHLNNQKPKAAKPLR